MPRIANTNYRKVKEGKILDHAHNVFCRKGYLNVTMQNIIDECQISRGGLYLYFSSVDEVFQQVVARRNKARFADIRCSVNEGRPFSEVLDDFIAVHKNRLLHMENSLLRAMYEYVFSKAEGANQAFKSAQFRYLRESVLDVLMLGVKQGVLCGQQIDVLVDHFIVVIEGLGVLALSEVLTERIVNEQFANLIDTIRRYEDE